jgi:hypothetical protein
MRIVFGIIDHFGAQDHGVGNEDDFASIVFQRDIAECDVADKSRAFANVNLVPDLELIRKHDDQSIDDIGDKFLGQNRNCSCYDGDTGQKFKGLDSKSKHEGDQNDVDIHDAGDSVDADHKIGLNFGIIGFLKVKSQRDEPTYGDQ